MLTQALTPADIKKMLEGLSETIRLDQIYVDSLPRDRFPAAYDDGMWRDWRRDHRTFIDKLVASVDATSPSLLQRLTEIASARDPALVGYVMVEVFAEIVGGCSAENCETAQDFFGWWADEVERQDVRKCRNASARAAMSKWLPAVDPLRIARDPECGYAVLASRRTTPRPA